MSGGYYHQNDEHYIGREQFTVKSWAFPEKGEIDFEMFDVEGNFLLSLTSRRPDLYASVLRRVWAGEALDFVTIYHNVKTGLDMFAEGAAR